MVFQSARIKSNVSPTFEGLPILLRFFWPVPYVSLSWPAENIKPPKWSSQRDKPSRPSGATNSFALAKHLRRLGKTNSILGPIFCIPNNRPIVRNAFDWQPKISVLDRLSRVTQAQLLSTRNSPSLSVCLGRGLEWPNGKYSSDSNDFAPMSSTKAHTNSRRLAQNHIEAH